MDFIMICGLPGSGKSRLAQLLSMPYDAVVLSSDKLRKELFDDEGNTTDNVELFGELHKRIVENLNDGKSVIYDATNINYKRRRAFLNFIQKTGCRKTCFMVATPYNMCVEQIEARERKVPPEVIKRMYMNFYIPQYYEGWDEINIYWNYRREDFDNASLWDRLNDFEQDNSHHTLTLGAHSQKCADLTKSSCDNTVLINAAAFHDIGKTFTKSLHNLKGEQTAEAHYYQHHLVGAYDAMFYLKSNGIKDDIILETCNYIQWHMQPYFMKTEKAKHKFINLVGEKFYKNLMILHNADKEAH